MSKACIRAPLLASWLLSWWVQFSLVTQSCLSLCDTMNRSTPGLPVHHQLPEFTQTQCLLSQWCHSAISSSVVPFSSCPQSLPAWVFSNESTLGMRWPKYWSFSFSIIPSKEHPGLISFRMDWLNSQERVSKLKRELKSTFDCVLLSSLLEKKYSFIKDAEEDLDKQRYSSPTDNDTRTLVCLLEVTFLRTSSSQIDENSNTFFCGAGQTGF